MHYTEEEDIPGLLLLIDFEKAFDTLSWNFIKKTLNLFNFGPSISKWVRLFYTNITSVVNQGGNLSEVFDIQRGCRQGDPLSPYIFLICAEILAIQIRKNKNIKGITIGNTEKKISQLADDTSIILDGSEKSLRETLKTLRNFSEMSGLHINYSKTHTVWIGSKKYSNNVLPSDSNLSWGTTKFTLLGIIFDVDLHKMPKLNYDPKLVKIKSILRQWGKRHLTPIGKITVIKTLVLPLLNHILMSIPNPSTLYCKELEKLFFSFVWNGPAHRVKKDVLIKKYEDGGLKMVNLHSFISSMKLFWIRYLVTTNRGLENLIPSFELNKFLSCGIEYVKLLLKSLKNNFWLDVFKSWVELQNVCTESNVIADLPLFYNHMIHIGGKTFYNKHLFDNNVRYINDVIDEHGDFLDYKTFCDFFPNVKINFLDYASIIHATNTFIKKSSVNIDLRKLANPFIRVNVYDLLRCKKSKLFYEMLNKNPSVTKGKTRWSELLEINNAEWKIIHNLPFKITKSTKLQWFQYRIINRILATNSFLFKIKKVHSKMCTFCHREEETIEHILWECDYVQSFLNGFEVHLNQKSNCQLVFTKKSFLLGIYDRNKDIQNVLFLWLKYYIYTSRCTERRLSVRFAVSFLNFFYVTQKFISYKNGDVEKFDALWNRWNQIFS